MKAQTSQRNDTEQNVQVRTDVAAEVKTSHDVDRLDHATTNRDITTDLASDEQEQSVEREYDTTLPVNPITGTPPLKKETTKNRQKTDSGKRQDNTRHVADNKIQIAEKMEAKSDIAARIDSNGIEKTAINAQVETAEKRGSTVWDILCIISLFVGVYYIIRFLKNIIKN